MTIKETIIRILTIVIIICIILAPILFVINFLYTEKIALEISIKILALIIMISYFTASALYESTKNK